MTAMRTALAVTLLFLAGGCGDTERAPALPGGGNGGGGAGNNPDAAPGDDGASDALITGSICLIEDVRLPGACSGGATGGIDVAVRGLSGSVLTTAGGAFALDSPGGASAVLEVGFGTAGVRNTVVEIPLASGGATGVLVPVVSVADWDALLTSLQTFEPDGTGTFAIYVRDGSAPVVGAQIEPPPGADLPFYDNGAALEWSQIGLTGNAGAALVFDVNDSFGVEDFTVIGPDSAPVVVTDVQVVDTGITFVSVDIDTQ